MPSLKLTLAARANGARSLGPITPEGKRRSSQNAIRHGLLARCIVMENESRASFDALLGQYLDRLQPADGVEFGFIEEMVAAYWRMRRAWAIETRLFENCVAAQPPGDEVDRMAAAFTELAASPGLGLMHRYETRLHCNCQRAIHNILLLRAAIPNEIAWPADVATPGNENGLAGRCDAV
jgi:hypothetical protein